MKLAVVGEKGEDQPALLNQDGKLRSYKAGFYERDSCQNRNLGMANYRPKDFDEGGHFKSTVDRRQSNRLDFAMRAAVQVIVELVYPKGKPLADYTLDLSRRMSWQAARSRYSAKLDLFKDL